MDAKALRGNLLLFTAALVWGATFVAQRQGMDHMGPLTFSGVRFLAGALCLLPLAMMARRRGFLKAAIAGRPWLPLWGSLLSGTLMALGINFQQVGLVWTTAGKAGFITGLYVVIVPVFGLFWKQRPGPGVWVGAPLAAAGLYFLSVTGGFTLAKGDGWVLVCAFAWAFQVLAVGWLSPRMDSFVLAFGQALVCAAWSLALAFVLEDPTLASLKAAWFPLAFGSIASVAVGFTLQVIGQRDAPPAHAAIILQLESVFAALAGWAILGEIMGDRALLGAGLMMTGMVTAQVWTARDKARSRAAARRGV
ncbi:MAG: DMT family transporter [Proteobacteria bacterium]|nr:DMT family transporter [Pseudomonadota bacterium]